MAYYDNPGQVNDEAISVAGGKTFQVIQVADSSGNIIDPAGGQIVIEGDVIVSEVEISNDVGHPIPVNDAGGSLTVDGPLTDTELRAAAVPVSGTINTLTGLDIPKHDNIALTYTGENLTAVAYKVGASTVATLTLAYTGSRLDSVTKS